MNDGIKSLQAELEDSYTKEREGFEARLERGDFEEGFNPPRAPEKSFNAYLEENAKWPDTEADLINYKPFQDLASQIWEHQRGGEKPRFDMEGNQVAKAPQPFIAQDRARWLMTQMSWFENNLTNMTLDAAAFENAPMEHVRAFATAREMYKRTETFTPRSVVEGTAAIMADPLSYIGITSGAAVAGRALTKRGVNELFQRAMRHRAASTALGVGIGSTEGAAAGGIYGYNNETLLSTASELARSNALCSRWCRSRRGNRRGDRRSEQRCTRFP
jgi:hypothetical protein